ncbi:Rnase Y domain-containing protein [Haliangium ochraceum]|uniref:Ribonuclease Y n=1 Tax=Haliangium ochraceum (strain DSM 14365 / JCM 11303 / SMP-2) TaxID=502025 RepID=D0LH11_HALO1|nr:Rnase Y domain-containing protein [Haliangium ochraceum]ACY14733.1 metal dependent phosphohydrolase [Haliangium ochraceum DSM 14365]
MPGSVYLLIAAIVAGATFALLLTAAGRRRREHIEAAKAAAGASLRGARIEATAQRRAAETEAREQALEQRSQAESEYNTAAEAVARRQERLKNLLKQLDVESRELGERSAALDERHAAIQAQRDRAQGLRRDAEERRQTGRSVLEERAGDSAEALQERMVEQWREEARAVAAQRLRVLEHETTSPESDREAKRVMEIAISRYQNHFLTERNLSNIRVGNEVCDLLTADNGAVHEVLQEIANVQLNINADGNAVRLEGLDGVGREVARRALNRLAKKASHQSAAKADPRAWAARIRENLEREITKLGKKAFQVLEIERPHAEIVDLVGALHYRTSYTQNQWLHAVEASFLAGMMAAEMELDVKLARRATLMHDIGKALTHKIEGSHAVIGADIARKLGEDELVANAIGAHHADEPPNSVYAYLVAAADAMSGARPGARRETTDLFSHRVEDLERIGMGYRGVERVHAVHGGRELRVYVSEKRIDDLAAVELSSEIAEQISAEMTFPGQIKVTVIRAFEAASTAN